MRLGALACITSLVACAQGIESPGIESLTSSTGLGGASPAAGAPSATGNTGNVSSAGSPVMQGGAPSAAGGSSSRAGSGNGGSSAGGSSAGASNGGSSAGSNSGGSSGSAGASTAGSSAGGAGPATGMCGHFQPGNMGPTLASKLESATDSIYFSVKIDNVDDRDVHLSDLKFRYYLDTTDLGTLTSEFYQKDVTAVNKTTRQLAADPSATVSPTYIEYSFPGSGDIIQMGEFLTLKVHTHNGMYKTHAQTADYSYNPSAAFMPWCKIVLYEQAPVAWGTTPP